MDSEHGSGSSNCPRTDAGAIDKNSDPLAPLILLGDSEHGSGNGTHSERKLNEKESGPVKSLKSSNSISSSGSSSSDDLFQVDLKVLLGTNASCVSSLETEGDVKALLRDDNVEDCSGPVFKLEESVNESAGSISHISKVTLESLLPSTSPMKSPPKQVMDKNGCYDPNRIPASIFASKPATPMDWSVASNESLFSIHIGNNSFSRDRVSMMGEDLFKSGELYKSGELHKPEELYLSRELQILGELNRSREPIKIRQASCGAKDTNMKIMDKQRKSTITVATDETEKNVLNGCINDHGELKVEEPRNSSTKHRTDGSGTSGQSLTFPILTNGEINLSGKEQHIQPESSPKVLKAAPRSWCSCFFCCSCCSANYALVVAEKVSACQPPSLVYHLETECVA